MLFEEENGAYFIVKCEKCTATHKRHKSSCKQYGDEYHFNPPIACSCGTTEKIAFIKGSVGHNFSQTGIANSPDIKNDSVHCPQCGSTQITAGNKGFALGKAAIGGLLLGPVGLLGGVIGSKKVVVTCLKCGKKWEAGKS